MDSRQLNRYQEQTSASKLRGEYYTPRELVERIFESLSPVPEDWILDPSCGDGSFLCGALEFASARLPETVRLRAGRELARRLVGFDIHPEAVAGARSNVRAAFRSLFSLEIDEQDLHIAAVDVLGGQSLPELLAMAGAALPESQERLLVVGNPPYVEAKRLSGEARAQLKKRFGSVIRGAPDLCLYFLHVCSQWLRPDDQLAFVLPNKVLVNAAATPLRERLLDEGRLRGLWFASLANVFPDAAVYPVIVFAGGAAGPQPEIAAEQITRAEDGSFVRSSPVAVPVDWYRRTAVRALFPPPESEQLRMCLDRCFAAGERERLGDVLEIRWSVSFHRAGLRERYVHGAHPGTLHSRRFLGGAAFAGNGEVTRYGLSWAGSWIDYDAKRLAADNNHVPPLPLFEQAKIVICQHGRTLRAAFDEEGFVLKDTFLCGVLRSGELTAPLLVRYPRAVVGLLCSRAAHFYYSHVFFGGHVNSGYLHFLQLFLTDIPIGEWMEDGAEAVSGLVRRRESCQDREAQLDLEEQIEGYVSAALGLSDEQQAAIRKWAEQEPNWVAREQVRKPAAI